MSEDILFCGIEVLIDAVKNSKVIGDTFNEYVE
jgi:hypothetical protein